MPLSIKIIVESVDIVEKQINLLIIKSGVTKSITFELILNTVEPHYNKL